MDKSVLLVSIKSTCCRCNSFHSSEVSCALNINTANPTLGVFVAYQILLMNYCAIRPKYYA